MSDRRQRYDNGEYGRSRYSYEGERDTYRVREENPRTPRSRRESVPARDSRPSRYSGRPSSEGRSERVQVPRERSYSRDGARRSSERRSSREEQHDYGYVGGRPSRISSRDNTQRVSGWTSNRPRSSRGSSNRGGRSGGSAASGLNPFMVIIAVLALVLLVFVGTRIASCVSSSGDDDPAQNSSQSGQNNTGMQTSGKLNGATETVDADGIVHGTSASGVKYTVRGRDTAAAQADKVTLVAVGDQIGTDQVLELTDSYAGTVGDGEYDFMPFYQEVAPFIQEFDLRFINQETIMAGNKEYDYSGYPSFNTPSAAADAISKVGFNLVNFGTNHTLDYGTYGVTESHKVWDQYPQLLVAGSYASQEERDTVHMIERNGITFALLSYCYGDNYLGTYENFPNSYHLAGFDKSAMETEIKRAQQVADVVIVAMHWGDEYTVELNDQQVEYAKFLADLDVDLVLGTHAHIMQKTAYVTGESGNTIPVVFGLSDFVSGWTKTNYILSGLFTCDFVRGEGGTIGVENLKWYPTIEWSDGGQVYVRFLKDMDEATTNANTRTENVDNDYTYLRDFIANVGMEIPVVL